MTSVRNAAGSLTRTPPFTWTACDEERSRSPTLEYSFVSSAVGVRPAAPGRVTPASISTARRARPAARYNAAMSEQKPKRILEHVKVKAALERLGRGQPRERCGDAPPSELLKAIHEFNAGEFFDQHE